MRLEKQKYKVNTQSLRLFGLRNVHAEDVHRADADRLGEKKLSTTRTIKEKQREATETCSLTA